MSVKHYFYRSTSHVLGNIDGLACRSVAQRVGNHSSDVQKVTCKRCMKTPAYKKALAVELEAIGVLTEINSVILDNRESSGWITAVICDRYVCAKVYNVPSTFGINNGRVSKLSVGKKAYRNPNAPYHDQMCFNYDRGLDFDRAPAWLIAAIVGILEDLPRAGDE